MNAVASEILKGYNSVPHSELENSVPFDKDALTFEQIDEILHYDPDTGKICWKMKTAKKIVVGTEAGCAKATRDKADGSKVTYRYIRIFGKAMSAPRVAWLLHHGEWPLGKVFFHDGNPLNTKADNLYMSNSIPTSHDHDTEGGRADYRREHRETYAMDWKDHHLRTTFDITLADYGRMLVEQEGKCGICGGEETSTRNGKVKALGVDHDHTTGKIRGLLCVACNTGIGKFKDNRDLLLAAVKYLDKHAGTAQVVPTLTVVSSEETH
jgi:hypothetical protein